MFGRFGSGGRRSSGGGRLIIALIVIAISVIGYFGTSQINPVTGENQHIDMTVDQEIALGLEAAPQMAQQFGGLSRDTEATQLVKSVGRRVLERSEANQAPYEFDFHLLADEQTVNAFALPGGQIFITEALLARLETEGQLAGVLAHEIGHVIGRHSAEQIAKQRLTQGVTMGAVIAATDPNDPSSYRTAQMAMVMNQLVNLRFGRNDELESDRFGVQYMAEAGYDPRSMSRVMEILQEASGGGGQPEFLSTHPDPGNRIGRIEQAIEELLPGGVPADLQE
jgi:beta-barrel assembly-enhancing protease